MDIYKKNYLISANNKSHCKSSKHQNLYSYSKYLSQTQSKNHPLRVTSSTGVVIGGADVAAGQVVIALLWGTAG